jgi:hypothetical protein
MITTVPLHSSWGVLQTSFLNSQKVAVTATPVSNSHPYVVTKISSQYLLNILNLRKTKIHSSACY